MSFNFRKIGSKIKNYPWKESAKSLRFLPKSLRLFEKIIVLSLSILVFLSLGYFWYSNWLKSTRIISSYGGEIREGIVGSANDLDKNVARLLNAGLTKYDSDKNIVGDLAQSWDINDAGKTYVFHLRPGFSSADLANQISAQGIWSDIEISQPDDQTLTFTFKQPFSPFLNVSTEPVFNHGPYQIIKESKDEINLQARSDYYGGRPYIDKITLVFYNSQEDLAKAIKRGDLQSYASSIDEIEMENSQKFEIDLPRDLDLFFNLSNKDLSNLNIRKALKDSISPGKTLNLRLVTSDTPKNQEYAQKLQSRWAQIGVNITLDIKDNVTLQKTTLPKRDYDLLLYGLDYGEDPDPYPFWHSSQIGDSGRNLSNFNNKQADRLLENARQEFDSQKRQGMYNQFQTILDTEIPMFVVEHQNYFYTISKKILGVEFVVGSTESDRFLEAATWYIKTKRVKI